MFITINGASSTQEMKKFDWQNIFQTIFASSPPSTTNEASSSQETKEIDWRYALFGPIIHLNSQEPRFSGYSKVISASESGNFEHDEEAAVSPFTSSIPTKDAFDFNKYDYIAIFIGANYCPSCEDFAPLVIKSAKKLEQKRRCKLIFVSYDKDEKNFEISCEKIKGIDVMPYDIEKAKSIRETFQLSTIPALMIVRNTNIASTNEGVPEVIANARHILVTDPDLKTVPWQNEDKIDNNNANSSPLKSPIGHDNAHSTKLSLRDMLFIPKKYGKNWWQLGHCINPSRPDKMYMDENAVRIRAGVLNVFTWMMLVSIAGWGVERILSRSILQIAMFEMITSCIFGLTPVAPIGTLATIMAYFLFPTPHWKPAEPKRFTWILASIMVINCILASMLPLTEKIKFPWKATFIIVCNVLTWLESSCGFCFGCFLYNNLVTKVFTNLEDCEECKI